MSENNIAVELAEGFAGDDVAILVDGAEVWHKSSVTTNYSVGLADVVRVEAPAGEATVEVQVRGKSDTALVDATTTAGEIRLRARIDPAGAIALVPADEQHRY